MKRLFPVVALLAAVALAGFAPRASAQGGVNLGWSDCGAAGASDKTFACTTNGGTPNLIVGSFDPPLALTQVVSIEAVVDIISQAATLPDWWKLKNPPGKSGFCRNGALTGNADFTGGPFTCIDMFAGSASGGIGAMLYPFPANPNLTTGSVTDSLRWARINMVYAVPTGGDLSVTPGTQYYAFKLSISNTKSTGVGSCAGCLEPVCIVLNQIRLVQPLGVGNHDVTTPISGQTRTITWQGGPGQPTCDLVPTKRATWGQIKSLYR